MSIKLTEYKPVLDVVIPVVQELVSQSEVEFYVPKHPEAIGLAIDTLYYLENLYPFLQIEVVAKRTMEMTKRKDSKARKFKVRAIFEQGEFSVPDGSEFLSYPIITIIDKDVKDNVPSKVSASCATTQRKYAGTKTKHMSTVIGESGIVVPTSRNLITSDLSYQTLSPFYIQSTYQRFSPVRQFKLRGSGESANYPVSSEPLHVLDRKSWSFFMLPVFWYSWAQYNSVAMDKLTGNVSYQEAARKTRHDFSRIKYHAGRAEVSVIEIIKGLANGTYLSSVLERFGCPYEYRSIYLGRTLDSIRYYCGGDLRDRRSFDYLLSLSEACRSKGFDITPQELSRIKV